MTDLHLTFTIPRDLWLTANRDLPNRGHKARIVRDLQTIAVTVARQSRAVPVPTPVLAAWEVRYPKGTGRKADAPNCSPTTKALLDGLVTAGVLTDDSSDHVIEHRYRRGPNLDRAGDHEVRLVLVSQDVAW